ncbi:MAG: hypothetical protein CMF62_01805 [Magnetococcales bacterium]|nr:hypothetical protein [Magnetococcales bacterium]|tara:strand:+ start:87979 stop:88767 length:789 start_codon:yes stop_codon:yes gene_type:complete
MAVYKRALLIGINYKDTDLQLNGCINDSRNLRKFLINNNFYNENEIIMMNDNKKNNLYPTRKNILAQFDKLVKFTKQNPDNKTKLFVSYSGHGYYLPDKNKDEADGQDEVLCPIDCNTKGYIKDDVIKRRLINKLNKNVEIVFMIDSCHSGTMCDLKFNYEVDERKSFKVYGKMRNTKCQCKMISGCKDDQVSMDAYMKDGKKYQYQGAMTNSFLKSYQFGISCEKLINKMREYLKKNNFDQVPQLSSGRKININKPFLLLN